MKNMLTVLLALLFYSSAHAADKIRIAYPVAAGHFHQPSGGSHDAKASAKRTGDEMNREILAET